MSFNAIFAHLVTASFAYVNLWLTYNRMLVICMKLSNKDWFWHFFNWNLLGHYHIYIWKSVNIYTFMLDRSPIFLETMCKPFYFCKMLNCWWYFVWENSMRKRRNLYALLCCILFRKNILYLQFYFAYEIEKIK